jgi:UDP-glucose:(heptosyl)LPS alpha-1,3-glucosyltransferase
LLARRKFDLVQSHERMACCDIYRAGDGVHREWLAQRARVLSPLGRLSLALNPYHRYTLRAERRLFESARLRAVICNSKMVRAEIQKYFRVPEDRLHVIYNGIDTNDFHPNLRRHRAEVRARYRIPDDATLFLFVGSGFERKGLAAALSALAGVSAAHLLVVGREKRLARFRAQARALDLEGRVHFAGVQPDVRPYYGAADAFILPTLYDPFPNVVLEAMASGLPVVTSRKCGAAELIRDGANGYVVDALDVAALGQSMTRLQASELRGSMGAAARQTVETLDFPRMAKELLTLYRACLAK